MNVNAKQNTIEQLTIQYYPSAYGEFILGAYQEQLVLCDWRYRKMRREIDERIQGGLQTSYVEVDHEFACKIETPVIRDTIRQLDEYFNGKRKAFELPLLFVGTDFQKLVWKELLKIPFGETKSYLELSRALGNENAIRAVAAANGANALSIVVPCHRIIGSKGELTGYAGGIATKRKLLKLESAGKEGYQPELFDDL